MQCEFALHTSSNIAVVVTVADIVLILGDDVLIMMYWWCDSRFPFRFIQLNSGEPNLVVLLKCRRRVIVLRMTVKHDSVSLLIFWHLHNITTFYRVYQWMIPKKVVSSNSGIEKSLVKVRGRRSERVNLSETPQWVKRPLITTKVCRTPQPWTFAYIDTHCSGHFIRHPEKW